MDEDSSRRTWRELELNDADLLEEIQRRLTARASGDPYGGDGAFAANIANLAPGLKAMAATHWLDISLALDSITWHFGNFGEPGLVAATEAGLRELGLHELAVCFAEARDLMIPLLSHCTEADGNPYDILNQSGLQERGKELDDRAEAIADLARDESLIYEAWIRYARQHPERVFDA